MTIGGPRELTFVKAVADYSQAGFEAANFVGSDSKDKKKTGWAIGGEQGKPHALTLLIDPQMALPSEGQLSVVIEQQSPHEQHTIGRLRLSVTDQEQVDKWLEIPGEILAAMSVDKAKRSDAQRQVIAVHYRSIAPGLAPQRKQIESLKKQLAELKPITVPIMRELAADKRRKTQIQLRGNFMNLGDEVEPGLPTSLHPSHSDGPIDRLALAHWLVDDDNPLTSRVLVNRYWERIFGTGLVSTVEDFGSQGSMPSNPRVARLVSLGTSPNRDGIPKH